MAKYVKGVPSWFTLDTSNLKYKNKIEDEEENPIKKQMLEQFSDFQNEEEKPFNSDNFASSMVNRFSSQNESKLPKKLPDFGKVKVDLEKLYPKKAEEEPSIWDGMRNATPENNKVLGAIDWLVDHTLGLPYKLAPTQRALVKTGNFIAGEGAMVDKDGKPLEAKDLGKIGNFITDSGALILGSAMTGPNGQSGQGVNLLNSTDEIANIGSKYVSKNLSKAPQIVQNFAPSIVRGAIDGGAGNALEAFGRNVGKDGLSKETPVETLNAAIQGALGGATLFGLGKGVQKYGLPAIKGLKNLSLEDITKIKDKKLINPVEELINPPKELPKVEGDMKVSNTIKPLPTASDLTKVLDETAAMKEPPLVEIPQPRKLQEVKLDETALTDSKLPNDGIKKSRFADNSLMNSEAIPDDLKANLKENPPMYDPITNKETWEKAQSKVEADFNNATKQYWEKNKLTSADDTALGQALIMKAVKDGNIQEANRLSADLSIKLTEAGQTVQAASIMKRLTPEGMLMYAQRQVKNFNDEIEKQIGKKTKKIELTEEESKAIIEGMKKAEGKTGREKEIEIGKVLKIIANKTPKTISDKIAAWQRIAMLFNPKTNVRNVLGNVILGAAENIKDIPGSLIDSLIVSSKKAMGKEAERTTLMPGLESFKTQAKGFAKGIKETAEDARLGIDTSISRGQFDLPQGRTFQNPVLNSLDKATNIALEFGDRPFFTAAYEESLRQQMKIAKVSEPTMEMIEKAKAFAEERTLQNLSNIAKGFMWIRDGINMAFSKAIGNKKYGVGNLALPFAKTPANILDKAIDYSPMGGLSTIIRTLGRGNITQKEFVDGLSRSITGTAAIWLGYNLAKEGYITGKQNKDKDVASLEKQMGKQPYSIKIGGKYSTFDWAQPMAIPLAIGADIFEEGKDTNDVMDIIGKSIVSGGTTLFEQSLLQGMQKLFGGYTPLQGIESILTSAPSSYVPTVFKQGVQLSDSTVRNTYNDSSWKQGLNMVKAKLPVLNKDLPPKIDTWGKEVKSFDGNNGLFNVLVNPSFSSTYKETPADKLIMDLYNETGDKTIFPRVAEKTFRYKNKPYTLTPDELTEFQKFIGQETFKKYTELANDKYFKYDTTDKKIKQLKKILDEVYNEGKSNILENRGIKIN